MVDTKFEKLSSLVLVDILAALPMENVVRVARLGHEKLRNACSLKWVKDRMTHVTIRSLVRSHRTGGDVATTFATTSVVKRLNGRIAICSKDFENTDYVNSFLKLAEKNSGKLYLKMAGFDQRARDVTRKNVTMIRTSLTTETKLSYISHTLKQNWDYYATTIKLSPEIVFEYVQCLDKPYHSVNYRPTLLKGRHVVDVLRAVCGPADVSEAELSRVRRAATETALPYEEPQGEILEGVMITGWEGGAIIKREETVVPASRKRRRKGFKGSSYK